MCRDSDEAKRDDLILSLIKSRYDLELQRTNELDNKANNMTGYISIIISLLIGTGTFGILGKISLLEFYIPYFLGIMLLVVSFFFSLSVIAIKKYPFVPRPETLIDKYRNKSSRFVTIKVSSAIASAMSDLRNRNNGKAKNIIFGWYFLIGGLILLLLFAFMIIFNSNVLVLNNI